MFTPQLMDRSTAGEHGSDLNPSHQGNETGNELLPSNYIFATYDIYPSGDSKLLPGLMIPGLAI